MVAVGYAFLALLVAVVAAPFVAELLRSPMSAERMAKAPGEIAHLPGGATHYRWSGPEDGPVIVCVHGLTTPSFIFAATERSLVSQGFRVLVYDLYGRGASARAPGKQDLAFFMDQLRALLLHQEVQGKIGLLGFSMGGQIAATFAAREDWVDRLVLVAPAGLTENLGDGPSPIWTAPIIGDWLTRIFGGMALRRQLVEHRSVATVVPNLEDLQAEETRQRGVLPAVLSSRRHTLSQSTEKDHRRLFHKGVPVLAIWGGEDPVIPLSAMGHLAKVNPDAHHVQVPGAGHNLLQTHPTEVARALRDFLS